MERMLKKLICSQVHKERRGEFKESEQNLATHHFKTVFAVI